MVDETGELTEAENGSIMSVGWLTYNFLERPVSDRPAVCFYKHENLYTQRKTEDDIMYLSN